MDLDATVVVAHSEKGSAAPTFKRTFGFHPLLAFVDHGPAGTGEPLAALLRPGSANANTAADHRSAAGSWAIARSSTVMWSLAPSPCRRCPRPDSRPCPDDRKPEAATDAASDHARLQHDP